MKLLKLGTLSLDRTQIQDNASRHSALSSGLIEKIEAQLKADVQELLALAEEADRMRPKPRSKPAPRSVLACIFSRPESDRKNVEQSQNDSSIPPSANSRYAT
jgi:hypothetical protein